jgi:hypothetical protein
MFFQTNWKYSMDIILKTVFIRDAKYFYHKGLASGADADVMNLSTEISG